jgi:hypothetical protein
MDHHLLFELRDGDRLLASGARPRLAGVLVGDVEALQAARASDIDRHNSK